MPEPTQALHRPNRAETGPDALQPVSASGDTAVDASQTSAARRRKPSPRQIEALITVAAGRVKWGNPYPRMARKGNAGPIVFLIDGHSVYAGEHATYARLSELGWIVERVDLLPSKTVPAQTRTYRTITGTVTRDLPEHQAPADDGWQAIVELTEAGHAVLAKTQTGRNVRR
ncbi:hypothetical protein [Mycobacterium avium]|uniref:hypothetical protein n=1 Tax=Mycobacterium avium TaxID=1764 RepID=UPI00111C613F|nr:hypothetical protein [Mycobacterium avium]